MTTTPTKKSGSALGSPLANLVARAATNLPSHTGATAQAVRRRTRGEVRIVLADVSSSMDERAGSRKKIEVLRDAILPAAQAGLRIVAFGSYPTDVVGAALPPPSGSTALHLALDHIAAAEPTHVLVISDGHPDDPRAALRAADRLGDVQIDVIYCGPDHDREGLAFMRRLARGGGQAHHRSMTKQPQAITQMVRTLALPSK